MARSSSPFWPDMHGSTSEGIANCISCLQHGAKVSELSSGRRTWLRHRIILAALVVLIIPQAKLNGIRFPLRQEERAQNKVFQRRFGKHVGKVLGLASALDASASVLLSRIVECNRTGAKRVFPSSS